MPCPSTTDVTGFTNTTNLTHANTTKLVRPWSFQTLRIAFASPDYCVQSLLT